MQLLISCNRQSPVTNLKASLNLRGNSSALINPLIPNAPFLYPLKTSENLKGINIRIFEQIYSPLDCGQIDIKLGGRHVMH